MITSSRQLMDRIKNLVGGDGAKAQTAMRLYAMERFSTASHARRGGSASL